MKKIFPLILVAGVGVALYFFMKKKHTDNTKNAIPEPKKPQPPKQKAKSGQFFASLLHSAPDIYSVAKGSTANRRQDEQNKNNPYVTAPSSYNAPPSNLPSWM